jgi:uncharacterized protein (UPF0548 family)
VSDPAWIRRRLAELADTPVNYDPADLDLEHPPPGWNVDDRCQPLPGEPPGPPVSEGSWEIARRLIRGYEFADPSLVRAHYDPDRPLDGREMLLELRALGLLRIHVGVRVVTVYDEDRQVDGGEARVYGWAYRTLQGHVEQGQMDWQVWKWRASGAVEFRVRAVSRTASIPNPLIRVGFWALRGHERAVFLDSTDRRMRTFTELALQGDPRGARVRDAASDITARPRPAGDLSHEQLARNLEQADPAPPAHRDDA